MPGPPPGVDPLADSALAAADPRAQLSPEQAQIVTIAVSDPAILNAIVATLTNGQSAIVDPALEGALTQPGVASGAGPTPVAPSPGGLERQLFGGG